MPKLISMAGVLAAGLLWVSAVQADGAAVYSKCKACHGADGKGNAAMKVAPFAGKSDAEMTKVIKEGKGKMPGYTGKLSDAEIGEVVKYIKTLK